MSERTSLIDNRVSANFIATLIALDDLRVTSQMAQLIKLIAGSIEELKSLAWEELRQQLLSRTTDQERLARVSGVDVETSNEYRLKNFSNILRKNLGFSGLVY